MSSAWGGRRVRPLIVATLELKGTTCHLCGLPGADSADHDPPRSALLAAGVQNPDDVALYLWPSHRFPCNVTRKDRPVTDALRSMLRARRLAYIGRPQVSADVSPRFANFFDTTPTGRGRHSFPFISQRSEKKRPESQGKGTDRD